MITRPPTASSAVRTSGVSSGVRQLAGGAGRDELGLVGRLGADLGVDAARQVQVERDLERDEHQDEHIREGGELPDPDAHPAGPSPPGPANMKPTPRTVWM